MNGNTDTVIDGVLSVLDKLNELVGTESFSQAAVEEKVRNVCNGWRSTGVEIDEFRLMLVIQVRKAFHISPRAIFHLRALFLTPASICWNDLSLRSVFCPASK